VTKNEVIQPQVTSLSSIATTTITIITSDFSQQLEQSGYNWSNNNSMLRGIY